MRPSVGQVAALPDVPSVRDWFAMHAPPMPEWYRDMQRARMTSEDASTILREPELEAGWRFCFADNMMARRAQGAQS